MGISIDEMLDTLSFAGAEMVNGNANHGPMASEALFALGRDEAVLPWVEGYRNRLVDRPSPLLPSRVRTGWSIWGPETGWEIGYSFSRENWRRCRGRR